MTAMLMFFSCYKTKFRNILFVFFITYLLYQNSLNTDIVFGLINFALIVLLVCFARLTNKANSVFSIFIKLIYSVIIDLISYFYWEISMYGVGLVDYIWQGIVFNSKDIVLSVLIFSVIVLANKIYKMVVNKNENRFVRCR